MIVCDLTHAYTPTSGGIRTYIDEKRRYLLEKTEHSHVLIIPGDRDAVERSERATTYRVAGPFIPRARPYRFFPRTRGIVAALSDARPDVIELDTHYMWNEAAAAFRYRGKAPAPIVSIPFHTDFAHAYALTYTSRVLGHGVGRRAGRIAEAWIRRVLRRADLTLAFSEAQQRRLTELGAPGAVHVPLGVDLARFHPANADPLLRSEIGVGPGDILLLYAGRFDTEKHVTVLLEALARLPDAPRFVLALAGDGPLRHALQQHAVGESRLRVLPYESDRRRLARLMASADIYVTAGPHETFGLSVVEAQASGLPVVGVRAGGLLTHVPPQAGRLGPVADAGAMATNILEVAGNLETFSAAARRQAEGVHSWESCFDAVVGAYEAARARALTTVGSGAPLRVLFVTHSFAPHGRPLANVGGMQRVATELHTALSRHPRVRLSTLALRSSARWYEVLTVPFLLRLMTGLAKRMRRDNPQVVLFSSMVTAIMAPMSLRRLPTARLAAIAHGKDVTLASRIHQKVWLPGAFRLLDAVLPVSSATAEACRVRGEDPERIHVVPNGIDAGRFADLPTRTEARTEVEESISLPPNALLLVAVGRQVRRKGTAWFVEHVVPQLAGDVHLAIAGEGPEEETIRQAAAAAGVSHRVHPLGRVTEQQLRALLVGGDLFVMPNVPVAGDMEGFGVVMLEAGIAGMATIGSDLEGIRDVITEGVNGHLIQSRDADAFARCIRRYDDDRVALAALSESARRHVESTFTWPAVADRYVSVLERLVAESAVLAA